MARGFTDDLDFSPIIGWELYQVQIDKYHAMLWFQSCSVLLNIADRFSFRSANGAVDYIYEVYGAGKSINLDSILREKIVTARIASQDRLDIQFANGDVLSIYDNPGFRSWWFIDSRETERVLGESFNLSDCEIEDMSEEMTRRRRTPT